jgi:hypothetical protein
MCPCQLLAGRQPLRGYRGAPRTATMWHRGRSEEAPTPRPACYPPIRELGGRTHERTGNKSVTRWLGACRYDREQKGAVME